MSRVVGVLAYPLGPDFGVSRLRPRTLRRLYRRALLARAKPRSREYMLELFAEGFPDGAVEQDVPAESVDEIVLLYPDAIGLGFGSIERRLPAGVPVQVVNGRRRSFSFDTRTRRALVLRRALERSMAGEALALAVAALLTPVLILVDAARGRR